MRVLALILTALLATTSPCLARPPVSPSFSSLAALGPRDEAPCDAWSETCRDVIMGSACFAAMMNRPTKETMLDCVVLGDVAVAEKEMCQCYGCTEPVVQTWATKNLACS